MIAYGVFLWHVALCSMLLVVWRLSERLGRAMRDDVGFLGLFPVAATLIAAAGAVFALVPLWEHLVWGGMGLDLVGSALGWFAAAQSWGWLLTEIRKQKRG